MKIIYKRDRSSEYPDVQRITSKLLETLEEFVRDRAKRPKSPERKEIEAPPVQEPVQDMNEIKALPPPEDDQLGSSLRRGVYISNILLKNSNIKSRHPSFKDVIT